MYKALGSIPGPQTEEDGKTKFWAGTCAERAERDVTLACWCGNQREGLYDYLHRCRLQTPHLRPHYYGSFALETLTFHKCISTCEAHGLAPNPANNLCFVCFCKDAQLKEKIVKSHKTLYKQVSACWFYLFF